MKLALLGLAAAFVMGAFGCGKNEAVKDMEALADRVCACEDLKCAGDEMKKASELITKHAKTTANESETSQILAAGDRIRQCMDKLKK